MRDAARRAALAVSSLGRPLLRPQHAPDGLRSESYLPGEPLPGTTEAPMPVDIMSDATQRSMRYLIWQRSPDTQCAICKQINRCNFVRQQSSSPRHDQDAGAVSDGGASARSGVAGPSAPSGSRRPPKGPGTAGESSRSSSGGQTSRDGVLRTELSCSAYGHCPPTISLLHCLPRIAPC